MVDQAANADHPNIRQTEPACAVSESMLAASLNGNTVCDIPTVSSR
jgi:hypothetical protein